MITSIMLCYSFTVQAWAQTEFDYELDAYYSNMSWTKGLNDQPIPVVKNLKELDIYKNILKDSLTPDFVLFEASINPLPIAGVLMRQQNTSLYPNGQASGFKDKFLESVTAGFEEPYALSLFAGRVLRFAPPQGMKTVGENKGYIGYLLSVGAHHIQQNMLIRDNWLELEWKIKGKRETELQYLAWSFRGGAKFHSLPEISDTFKLGIRRDRIDYQKAEDDFMRDIGFDYQLDVLQHTLKPSKQTLLMDKHWPLLHGQVTMTLGFGVIWQGAERYMGVLATTQDKWTFVFRPNVKF
ncbi:MAG: hypothetical protein Q9N67_10530 [Ghiorsea sp.]|nr:hypothetical protein [Ghiorsea sp.]